MTEINDKMILWKNLFVPKPVLDALAEDGFIKPTDIQRLTLVPAIRDRKDVLGAAATGTGKTLAFGIPMIARILHDKEREIDQYNAKISSENNQMEINEQSDNAEECDENEEECDLPPSDSELEMTWKDGDIVPEIPIGVDVGITVVDKALPYQHIYGLVLTPTRELAVQVTNHLVKACRFTDLNVAAIYGGMSVEKQERLLRKRPEILVVTPGRFWSFISDQDPHALTAAKTSVLVIDEADRMLEKGHFQELESLIDWMSTNRDERKPRQTFVFSATLTFVHTNYNLKYKAKKTTTKGSKLDTFVQKLGMSARPHVVEASLSVSELHHWTMLCPDQPSKDVRLFWFLRQHPGRTLVFVNSKNSVRRLVSVLRHLGQSPLSLNADMIEKARLRSLEKFTTAHNSLLVATDVAARGLDIPSVDYVLHFDVAHTAETHLHRSGRTARALNPGHSVVFFGPKEVSRWRTICHNLGKAEEEFGRVDMSIEVSERYTDAVEMAKDLEAMEHKVSKISKDKMSMMKMAEEADIILDDEIIENYDKKMPKFSKVDQKRQTMELRTLLEGLDTRARRIPVNIWVKEEQKYLSPILEMKAKEHTRAEEPVKEAELPVTEVNVKKSKAKKRKITKSKSVENQEKPSSTECKVKEPESKKFLKYDKEVKGASVETAKTETAKVENKGKTSTTQEEPVKEAELPVTKVNVKKSKAKKRKITKTKSVENQEKPSSTECKVEEPESKKIKKDDKEAKKDSVETTKTEVAKVENKGETSTTHTNQTKKSRRKRDKKMKKLAKVTAVAGNNIEGVSAVVNMKVVKSK